MPEAARSEPGGGDVASDDLLDRLRALRKRLADERSVPACIVFSDATLRAMAEARPTSPAEPLEVPGVGPAKLERYGAGYPEVLRDPV